MAHTRHDEGQDAGCAEQERTGDHFVWGVIIGSTTGAALWTMFDVWWLAGIGMLAGIAAASWMDQSDR
ncbi:hypothetical protein [Aeromicrobium sp. Leaf350]|uniref:hypothetical protein n=1 Tax=Aeromicrobium sp. Leaf350 TaxID=2876565 RepID=UPI001E4DBB10|nr:hypothetical protein [Aeromicrobium sp. Leaf350]